MGCTETVVHIQSFFLNGGEDRAAPVRSDKDLALDGVKSELAHRGGRIGTART